jgi:hypothetical protein
MCWKGHTGARTEELKKHTGHPSAELAWPVVRRGAGNRLTGARKPPQHTPQNGPPHDPRPLPRSGSTTRYLDRRPRRYRRHGRARASWQQDGRRHALATRAGNATREETGCEVDHADVEENKARRTGSLARETAERTTDSAEVPTDGLSTEDPESTGNTRRASTLWPSGSPPGRRPCIRVGHATIGPPTVVAVRERADAGAIVVRSIVPVPIRRRSRVCLSRFGVGTGCACPDSASEPDVPVPIRRQSRVCLSRFGVGTGRACPDSASEPDVPVPIRRRSRVCLSRFGVGAGCACPDSATEAGVPVPKKFGSLVGGGGDWVRPR